MAIKYTILGLFEGALFSDVTFFLALMIVFGFLIGAFSGRASIAIFGGFLFFIPIAVQSDIALFNNLLYVIMTLVILVFGFRLWDQIQSGPGDNV